jgi:zinc/manganese transport system substrate-binding protein
MKKSPQSLRRYRTTGALIASLGLVLASCGGDTETSTPATSLPVATTVAPTADTTVPAGPRPTLVASTTIWADVVSNVTCTNLAEVVTIIPAGADSHTFEPSLRDRETMGTADLIIMNGLFLEEGLLSTFEAVAAEGVPLFAMTDAVRDLLESEDDDDDHEDHGHDEDHDDDDHDDDDHDDDKDDHDDHAHETDPHIWFDPARVKQSLPALTAAIIAATDLNADEVQACSDAYASDLDAIDAEMEELFAAIPTDLRKLVTNHGTLGYLADRYGFEVIGTVLGGTSSLAETNPAALEELAQLIIAAGLPAIFTEAETSARDIEALASRVGNLQVISLLTESLDAPGTSGDSYIGLLRSTAEAILSGLGN